MKHLLTLLLIIQFSFFACKTSDNKYQVNDTGVKQEFTFDTTLILQDTIFDGYYQWVLVDGGYYRLTPKREKTKEELVLEKMDSIITLLNKIEK